MEEGAAATITTTTKKRNFHHHHDRHRRHVAIQNAEKELLQLDQRTKDLKDFIRRLREEDKEEVKKLRSDCIINDSSVADSSSNEEDDDDKDDIPLLHHVLEYLGPGDIASCAQVSQQWNYDIDGNPQIWKMAVQNQSSVEFIHFLERKTNTTNNSNSQSSSSSSKNQKPPPPPPPPPPPLFYKKVALGLIKTQSSSTTPVAAANIDRQEENNISVEDADWLVKQYKPKLQREDVIVYIEIKDKATDTVLHTWYTTLIDFVDEGKCAMHWDDLNVLLPTTVDELTFQEAWEEEVNLGLGDADYRESFAPEEIHNSIYFTIRCFRYDTGESLYWSDIVADDNYEGLIFLVSGSKWCAAKNDSGIIARDVWRIRNCFALYMRFCCRIEPIFPEHNEDEVDSNNGSNKIGFRLSYLYCAFNREGQDSDQSFEVDDVNELLLSLEGMVWQ